MKREIIFRGFSKLKSEFIFGNYQLIKGKHYIFPTDEGIDGTDLYEVYRGSIGQYIGLKDEEGEAIFENDIIKYYDRYYIVIYLQEFCRFVLRDLNRGTDRDIQACTHLRKLRDGVSIAKAMAELQKKGI